MLAKIRGIFRVKITKCCNFQGKNYKMLAKIRGIFRIEITRLLKYQNLRFKIRGILRAKITKYCNFEPNNTGNYEGQNYKIL